MTDLQARAEAAADAVMKAAFGGFPFEMREAMVAGALHALQSEGWRPNFRHKARGSLYQIIGHAELQAATGAASEGDILTIYRGEDGHLWARRASEFGDGRFERLSTPPEGETS